VKRIEVFKAGLLRRQWAFRFVADNGEIVAQSEMYRRKMDAENAARLLRDDFKNVDILEEP
jgi:uncharacterized protein YegP (UPF0339 family)